MVTRFDYFKGYNEPKTPQKLIQIACKPLSNLMFSEAFHSTQTTCILNVSFQFAHVANLHQTKRPPRVYTECKQNANSMFSKGLHARQTFANFQICQQICKGLHRCLIGNHHFCNRFAHSMQAVSLHACKPGKLAKQQARNLQQIYLPVCKRAN